MKHIFSLRRLGLVAVALCALPVAAIAADLGGSLKDDAKAFAEAPSSTWTGRYAGLTLGVGMNTTSSVEGYLDYDEYGSGHATNKGNSLNLGGTLGYNRQYGHAVFGVEGDFSWTNAKMSDLNYDSEVSLKSSWNWFATLRARAGYATDNVLLYVTGGPALVGVKHKSEWVGSDLCGVTTEYTSCVSTTKVGMAVGAGIEAKLDGDWSMKGEYLHIELPTINTTDYYGYNYKWNDSADIFRVGLNRRF